MVCDPKSAPDDGLDIFWVREPTIRVCFSRDADAAPRGTTGNQSEDKVIFLEKPFPLFSKKLPRPPPPPFTPTIMGKLAVFVIT
jgi:hypothetical protein